MNICLHPDYFGGTSNQPSLKLPPSPYGLWRINQTAGTALNFEPAFAKAMAGRASNEKPRLVRRNSKSKGGRGGR